MDRKEIAAEIVEVEGDLAYIARRAEIAAGNLKAVAAAFDGAEKSGEEYSFRYYLLGVARNIERAAALAKAKGQTLARARADFFKRADGAEGAADAAKEGGAE